MTVINSLIEDNVNNSLLGKHPELSEDPNKRTTGEAALKN